MHDSNNKKERLPLLFRHCIRLFCKDKIQRAEVWSHDDIGPTDGVTIDTGQQPLKEGEIESADWHPSPSCWRQYLPEFLAELARLARGFKERHSELRWSTIQSQPFEESHISHI